MTHALSTLYAPTTDADFLRVFNRLCMALREPPDETGMTQQTYYELLHDLPISALKTAAIELAQEQGRRFFPTVAEWRTTAQSAQRASLQQALSSGRVEPWHEECEACRDTGWQYRSCDGSAICGRKERHAGHEYVSVCACRPMNRTFQQHRVCA